MLKHIFLSMAVLLVVGCASVPMQDVKTSGQAKAFNAPTNGNAGLYVYRDTALGSALKKDVWVDGECLGETAPKMFFLQRDFRQPKACYHHRVRIWQPRFMA